MLLKIALDLVPTRTVAVKEVVDESEEVLELFVFESKVAEEFEGVRVRVLELRVMVVV